MKHSWLRTFVFRKPFSVTVAPVTIVATPLPFNMEAQFNSMPSLIAALSSLRVILTLSSTDEALSPLNEVFLNSSLRESTNSIFIAFSKFLELRSFKRSSDFLPSVSITITLVISSFSPAFFATCFDAIFINISRLHRDFRVGNK